jgi:predicted homoserine dehydrogenase-like protein
MDVVAISNRTTATAHDVFKSVGVDDTVEEVDNQAAFDDNIASGRRVVTDRPELLAANPDIEAIVEATGEVEFGATVAEAAISGRKHIVLVNAELDATVGPILRVMADEAGIVISNADGDEPAVAMNLLRFVRTIGYKPVLVGNVKGFYDPHRNPETQAGFARQHGQRPKMITSFADGTKLSMEASVLANASGFSVAKRGMSGFRCGHVKDVLGLYDFDQLLKQPIVDFVLGAEPGSGAFVVGHDDDPERRAYMEYFKMGEGPFHVFYRPFHLTHLEAPLSVARAVLFGDAAIRPGGAPRVEVITHAKIDLAAGQTLDGIGGFTCYGVIDNIESARGFLPMGLSEGAVLRRTVSVDTPIRREDVDLPKDRVVDRLRARQEAYFGS